jgi:hypothetical protein
LEPFTEKKGKSMEKLVKSEEKKRCGEGKTLDSCVYTAFSLSFISKHSLMYNASDCDSFMRRLSVDGTCWY